MIYMCARILFIHKRCLVWFSKCQAFKHESIRHIVELINSLEKKKDNIDLGLEGWSFTPLTSNTAAPLTEDYKTKGSSKLTLLTFSITLVAALPFGFLPCPGRTCQLNPWAAANMLKAGIQAILKLQQTMANAANTSPARPSGGVWRSYHPAAETADSSQVATRGREC